MDTIRWGIIGCGDVCEKKSGPAFYKIEHSELNAVMRRDAVKVKDFARRHHVQKYYTDVQDIISDPDIDAIYVATPPNTHKEYSIKAMRAGKPVYVEKPMAMNYEECCEMIMVARNFFLRFIVVHYRILCKLSLYWRNRLLGKFFWLQLLLIRLR